MKVTIDLRYHSGKRLQFIRDVPIGSSVSLYDQDFEWCKISLDWHDEEGLMAELDKLLEGRPDWRMRT